MGITNSNKKLDSSKLPINISKIKDSSIVEGKKIIFIPDFISPTDEIFKTPSAESESQKSGEKNRQFFHTSENWIG